EASVGGILRQTHVSQRRLSPTHLHTVLLVRSLLRNAVSGERFRSPDRFCVQRVCVGRLIRRRLGSRPSAPRPCLCRLQEGRCIRPHCPGCRHHHCRDQGSRLHLGNHLCRQARRCTCHGYLGPPHRR